MQRTKGREDKHVRIVADCAPFRYQNKQFDECDELEEWWHQRPIEGSYLCPYRKSLGDTFPYDYHRYRVFANHDTIIDEHAQIMGSFIWKPHNNNNSYNGDIMTTQTKSTGAIDNSDSDSNITIEYMHVGAPLRRNEKGTA